MRYIENLESVNKKMIIDENGLKITQDAILLSEFIKKYFNTKYKNKEKKTILEIGAGQGIITLLLSKIEIFEKIFAVEIQKDIFEIFKKNIKINNLEEKITSINEDIKTIKGEYDFIFSNPPYKKINSGKLPENEAEQISKYEILLTLEELFYEIKRLLKNYGEFFVIVPDDRLNDVFRYIYANNMNILSIEINKYKKKIEFYNLDAIDFLKKIENKKMIYAHFTDIIRLALLYYYGGVWLDATVLLTDNIPQKYFEMEYFMFQRDDNLKDKKKWEDFDSVYFSWDKDMRIRVMNSVIFAKKNSKVIKTLLDLLLIFWKDNEKAPKYFFFQILYYELMKNYYKKYQCEIISDTYSHELMRVWYEKYKEKEFEKIKEKTSIHKLSFKWGTAEEEYENTYFRYLKKLYNI